jgi:hypothetical protein
LSVAFQQAIPVLRIFSVEKAREFYVDFPLYAQVSRTGLTLHLSEHYGDGSPGAGVLLFMTGLDDYHRALTAKAYRYYRPGIEEAEWGGARVMKLRDPVHNYLTFAERK